MWAIEIRTKYLGVDSCDSAYAVYRSVLKYLDLRPDFPSHKCFHCQNGEIGIEHAIELVDADLSEIQSLSGRWRRVAPSIAAPGKMASTSVQVEIYQLGQPSVKVSFDQPKRNGATNWLNEETGILLIGRSATGGEFRTHCRSAELAKTKATIVDILSSWTDTDSHVISWVERPPIEKPFPWLEGDFSAIVTSP